MLKLKNVSKANIVLNYTVKSGRKEEKRQVILPAGGVIVEVEDFKSDYLDTLKSNGEVIAETVQNDEDKKADDKQPPDEGEETTYEA